MGSRVMHYCISSLIAKELGIQEDQFLLGGIAPDVHKNMNEPKSRSHFVKVDAEGKAYADFEGFRDKYLSRSIQPFHLGYYYHLISDWIWVEEVYVPKIKWLPQPEKKEAQAMYYRDFWRLNGKLIDHYALKLKPLEVKPVVMDEIDYSFLPELINDLSDDFAKKDEAKAQDLEILDFQEVLHVLEKSVNVCVDKLSIV